MLIIRGLLLAVLLFPQLALAAGADADRGVSALLSYCVDRSGMTVLNDEGAVVPADHLRPRCPESALLLRGDDGVWRVAEVRNEQDRQC